MTRSRRTILATALAGIALIVLPTVTPASAVTVSQGLVTVTAKSTLHTGQHTSAVLRATIRTSQNHLGEVRVYTQRPGQSRHFAASKVGSAPAIKLRRGTYAVTYLAKTRASWTEMVYESHVEQTPVPAETATGDCLVTSSVLTAATIWTGSVLAGGTLNDYTATCTSSHGVNAYITGEEKVVNECGCADPTVHGYVEYGLNQEFTQVVDFPAGTESTTVWALVPHTRYSAWSRSTVRIHVTVKR